MVSRTHTITGHGGVRLHVRDFGPEDAPAIMLIHGWSQHHLSWQKQIDSDLAQRFRLVVPDLRGHGASEKPTDPAAYDNSAPWAGDIAATIDALALAQPLLVGWSMGGWLVGDYLGVMGDGTIAGVVTIGASASTATRNDPAVVALRGEATAAVGSYSDDQAEEIAAIIAFVRACSAHEFTADELAMMVGLNMLCPPYVRRACRVRDMDHRPAFAALTKPAMVIHGAKEQVCVEPLFKEMVATLPNPEVHVYGNDGHMPFWESPERFNADLAAFAARAFGMPA